MKKKYSITLNKIYVFLLKITKNNINNHYVKKKYSIAFNILQIDK